MSFDLSPLTYAIRSARWTAFGARSMRRRYARVRVQNPVDRLRIGDRLFERLADAARCCAHDHRLPYVSSNFVSFRKLFRSAPEIISAFVRPEYRPQKQRK